MAARVILFLSLSIPAFAQPLRCSMVLLTPFTLDPTEGSWISTGADVIAFDYDTTSEKTLFIGVDEIHWPSAPARQFTLTERKNAATALFTLEFSKTGPYGQKFEGDDYGFFQIFKGQDKKDARWAKGNIRIANMLDIPVVDGMKGQVIMTCVEK